MSSTSSLVKHARVSLLRSPLYRPCNVCEGSQILAIWQLLGQSVSKHPSVAVWSSDRRRSRRSTEPLGLHHRARVIQYASGMIRKRLSPTRSSGSFERGATSVREGHERLLRSIPEHRPIATESDGDVSERPEKQLTTRHDCESHPTPLIHARCTQPRTRSTSKIGLAMCTRVRKLSRSRLQDCNSRLLISGIVSPTGDVSGEWVVSTSFTRAFRSSCASNRPRKTSHASTVSIVTVLKSGPK
jgi:hypothetical protein